MGDDLELAKLLRRIIADMPIDQPFLDQAADAIERLTAEVRELSLSQITIQGQAWDNHNRAEAAEAEAARLREEVAALTINRDLWRDLHTLMRRESKE